MSFSRFDHQCMATALKLAARGLVSPHPNPRVGCVISNGHDILGRGWHKFAGGPHAEIAALQDAARDVEGATAYVTLEPCSHHGQTPPCTEALISAGVARIVVASKDPNPEVNGQGLKRLSDAGVTVQAGLMAAEAEALNQGFFMRMQKGRPWVRVKTAISLDGRTALGNGDSKWISGEASRRDVQKWRARSAAILTGIGTVLADDPAMTVRLENGQHGQNWQHGQTPGRQPLRVIADSRWRTPADSRILAEPATAIIAGTREVNVPPELEATGAQCISLPAKAGKTDLVSLLFRLAEMEFNEVQVEAGARLCGALLNDRLVDELLIYQAPHLLGDGGPGPFAFGPLESMARRTHLKVLESRRLGNDWRLRLEPLYEPA